MEVVIAAEKINGRQLEMKNLQEKVAQVEQQ